MKFYIYLFAVFFSFSISLSAQTDTPPSPELVFRGSETVSTPAGEQIVYRLGVSNRLSYSDAMFEVAADLPPCGRTRNASRTWVDIYAANGRRLYGFCALKSAEELNTLMFQLPARKVPSGVYIVLLDRRMNVEYRSNTIKLD